jgi:hypothetical protein
MHSFRIREIIHSLPNGIAKSYVRLYPQHGLEMGFGRSGSFEAHSHFVFYDVIFSPNGIDYEPRVEHASQPELLVVPPQSLVPPVRLGDFFFVKFCPDPVDVVVPDKTVHGRFSRDFSCYLGEATLSFPWYPSGPSGARRSIVLTLSKHRLSVVLGGTEEVSIER